VTTPKTMRSRVGILERSSTTATRLVWVDDWETADESGMLANGEISSPGEVTLLGWRGPDDQLSGVSCR
jgi:hypothetical protein